MEDAERFITRYKKDEDGTLDVSLRPKTLDEYVGQEKMKSNLKVFIEASKKRNEALDHVLLYGPPGLGKTTMAHIIAAELGVPMRITSGPAIERSGDIAAILSAISKNGVVFIDEIHRLNRTAEEILYSAMEDYVIDMVMGKGPGANTLRLNLPPFTIIGATTRAGMLTGPLRDRFGVICRLELYTPEELAVIVNRSAKILKIELAAGAAEEIAKRSRGTPRIANRLLKRVRDFAEVSHNGKIDVALCNSALELLDVDKLGLDFNDRKYLSTIIEKFDGGPVGLDTISSAINEDGITIEDVIEPYLIQLGFIAKTPRGRVCLSGAYKHLGYKVKRDLSEQISFDEDNR